MPDPEAEARFESDYAPVSERVVEMRVAHALEHIAYQLGAIKQELRELNARERGRAGD